MVLVSTTSLTRPPLRSDGAYLRLDFLQEGILLQLLLHERFELKGGCLEQRKRLLELRRQHLLQRHLLRQIQTLCHVRIK